MGAQYILTTNIQSVVLTSQLAAGEPAHHLIPISHIYTAFHTARGNFREYPEETSHLHQSSKHIFAQMKTSIIGCVWDIHCILSLQKWGEILYFHKSDSGTEGSDYCKGTTVSSPCTHTFCLRVPSSNNQYRPARQLSCSTCQSPPKPRSSLSTSDKHTSAQL